MELLLLFILFSLNEDPNFKEKLRAFLGFYRENRALFASLAEKPAPPHAQEEEKPQEKDRPEEGGDVLFSYLSRLL